MLVSMRAMGSSESESCLDETELADASIDARHGIEQVGVVFWTSQSSLMLASMRAVGSSESESCFG